MIFRRGEQLRGGSRTGIQSKFGRVLLLQLLFISVTTALGVYTAAIVVEKVMIGTALSKEASHYWEQLALNPDHPLPNTDNLRGYSSIEEGAYRFPASLLNTALGQSRARVDGKNAIIYIEERLGRRLLLVFDEQSVKKLSFWFGVVPLSLALVTIYLSAWFVYRQSNKTLSPLMSLAQKMRHLNLDSNHLENLSYDNWSGPKVDDEVRVLADSLRDFTERLKSQFARERAFSRDVSHELRTPLSVMRGSLELLEKQGNLDKAQERVVDRMQTTSRDMQSLIEALLVLAQAQYRDTASLEVTHVNSLVPRLVSQTEMSHNADQHVSISLEQQSQLEVNAPTQVVAMVVVNLLRNACNYTDSGDVKVKIYPLGIRVSDTGAGMHTREVNRLQQPFQRDSDSNTGYGLGLDIVRRLCDCYGWELIIQSSQGQGTQVDIKMKS